MRYRSVLLGLFLPAMNLLAVEGPLFELNPPIPMPAEMPAEMLGNEPGRVDPALPAQPVAIEFSWDGYRTLVVVGDGVGLIRPAWVATYEAPVITGGGVANLVFPVVTIFGYRQSLAVAYRAQAFLDREGHLHIDARKAVISGPMANEWFPDSFRFTLTDPATVETIDDQDSSNHGVVDAVVYPATDSALFETLQTRVQILVGDGI